MTRPALQFARYRPSAFRAHAVPELSVIPVLRGVVEDGFRAWRCMGRPNEISQRQVSPCMACQEFVQFRNIGRMMLAVMEFERLRRHVRGERIQGIGKFSKDMRHVFTLRVQRRCWRRHQPRRGAHVLTYRNMTHAGAWMLSMVN